MRAPIQSLKHYVQMSLATAAAGAAVNTIIVLAAETVGASAANVRIGAIVKAIYVELWVRGETNQGAFQVAIGKASAGDAGPTFTEIGNMHDFNQKNNVFYFSQGLSTDSNTFPTPVYKGWIKIPKGKQRMALGERWYIVVAGLALAVEFCGTVIYKEYF